MISDEQSRVSDLEDPSVPVSQLIGIARVNNLKVGAQVPRVIARMAQLGIHPFDGAGISKANGKAPGEEKVAIFCGIAF